jgi:glyoxylase-like metal-dependent hydrolase (beta-lactamase superfamily II)
MDATGAPVAAHGEDAAAMPVAPTILVSDGDTISAGTVQVKVIHTPGHTPGSVCYLTGKHLFSGDTLFAGGVGQTPSVEELVQLYKSITEKLYVLPDDTFLLPGHGRGSMLGAEKAAYRALVAQYPDVLPPIQDTPPTPPLG